LNLFEFETLFEFGFENPIEKDMDKELENPEKKKRIKQPSRPKSAQPGRAPVHPRRLTGGPRLSAAVPLSRSRSLSRSLPAGANLSVPVFFTRALPLSLCLAGSDHQSLSRCPVRPFLLSLRHEPALSVPPPPRSPWTGACALTHVARFLGHDARPRAQLPS
jgi:hypothetical protein